jgi:hypothetical protein
MELTQAFKASQVYKFTSGKHIRSQKPRTHSVKSRTHSAKI